MDPLIWPRYRTWVSGVEISISSMWPRSVREDLFGVLQHDFGPLEFFLEIAVRLDPQPGVGIFEIDEGRLAAPLWGKIGVHLVVAGQHHCTIYGRDRPHLVIGGVHIGIGIDEVGRLGDAHLFGFAVKAHVEADSRGADRLSPEPVDNRRVDLGGVKQVEVGVGPKRVGDDVAGGNGLARPR